MLDALPEKVREVILQHKFIVKYLEGKLPKEVFLKDLKEFEATLLASGLDKEHLLLLYSSDDESEFRRKVSYSRFARFARRIGLDIATHEDKVT